MSEAILARSNTRELTDFYFVLKARSNTRDLTHCLIFSFEGAVFGRRLLSESTREKPLVPRVIQFPRNKGRTIRKVMGGVGKKPKKNSCKGKCPKKKFMHKMGLILI